MDWAADGKQQQQRKQEQDSSSSDFHSETGLPSRIVTPPFPPHTAEKRSLGPALCFCLTKGGDKACINLGYVYQIVSTITSTSSKTVQVTYVRRDIYQRILGYATGSKEGLNLLFRASRTARLWGHQEPRFSLWGTTVKQAERFQPLSH